MIKKSLTLLLAGSLLSACSTFSFAPPTVNLDREIGGQSATNCSLAAGTNSIGKDFNGALNLINNFLVTYRCASREAADGRQIFQVPSFLAIITGAIGPSFGLSDDGALAAAAGAAAYSKSNSYYAPADKADQLNSAIDAITCIKLESVGIAGFDIKGESKPQNPQATDANDQLSNMADLLKSFPNLSEARRAEMLKVIAKAQGDPSGYVEISAQRQYYELVSGALMSVERILAKRLNKSGSFDPSSLVAEIEKLAKKAEDNEGDGADDGGAAPLEAALQSEMTKSIQSGNFVQFAKAREQLIKLQIPDLQPKLQKCVVLAKL